MANVKFLTYNNKKLPIKLGVFTMMIVQEEHGIIVTEEGIENEDGTTLTPSQYIPLLFHALEQGHHVTKRPFTFVREDMHDILNECLVEFTIAIPTFFPEQEEEILGKLTGAVERGMKRAGKQTTSSSSGKQSQPSKSAPKK